MNRLVILLLVAVTMTMVALPSEGAPAVASRRKRSNCFGICPSWCSKCSCRCYPTDFSGGWKCNWECNF